MRLPTNIYVSVVCGCLILTGCRPGTETTVLPTVLTVSGDTSGWIVPCGCASKQLGGLPRRAALVEKLRENSEVIVVDVGGAVESDSHYDRLKFAAILRGEKEMQCSAHNAGEAECQWGAEFLRKQAGQSDNILFSANVRDRNGQPLLPPARLVTTRAVRLLLIGVVDPRLELHPSLSAVSPRDAVLDTLERFAGEYDSAVVLAYLREDALRELSSQLPEVDAVIGGPTGQSIAPVALGPTLLASATNLGKFIVQLEYDAEAPLRWQGSVVELDESWHDHTSQVANLKAFYDELERLDVPANRTSFVEPLPPNSPPEFQLAGSEACRSCHERDCEQWNDSRHSFAWQELKEDGSHVDPSCQRCHTDGYGMPGGFVSLRNSPDRVNVGCESCHGPSAQHAADPRQATPYLAADRCITCHDRENSPEFEYQEFWEQIEHGHLTSKQ